VNYDHYSAPTQPIHASSVTEALGRADMPAHRSSGLAPLLLPVLASIYVPLAVTADVPSELVRLRDLAWPVGLTCTVTLVAWGLAYVARRSAERAGLAATLVAMVYSFLGAGLSLLGYQGDDLRPHLMMAGGVVALYAVALAALVVVVLGTRRPLSGLTRYLTVWATLLVAWNAGKVTWFQIHPLTAAMPPRVDSGISAPPTSPTPAPDIYLIVLDKYTGSKMLAATFGFDNHPFEEALRSRGFAVPTDAQANYVHTFLALEAMLNLRYSDDLTARFGNLQEWEVAYPLIENNRLAAFLHDHGYTIATMPTAFAGTRLNRYADRQLIPPREVRPEIYARWVPRTAGPALRMLGCAVAGCMANVPPYQPSTVDVLERQFEAVRDASRQDGHPLFVFAHLLVPHEPYVYGPECQHRAPFWPQQDTTEAEQIRRRYLDQIRCLNTTLLALVDTIRSRSRVPPVILLQGDHGHGRLGRMLPSLSLAAPDAIRERTSVFAAYLLPGLPTDSVWAGITPVNALRLVLRHYFHADLPSLPDRTFWSAARQPYIFLRVR
jgi:hypothetical protein